MDDYKNEQGDMDTDIQRAVEKTQLDIHPETFVNLGDETQAEREKRKD